MKSFLKALAVALLFSIVMLGLAVFYFIRAGYVKGLLQYALDKYTGVAVSFRTLKGNPLRGITLHDSAFAQRDKFRFSARVIRVTYALKKNEQRPFSVSLSVDGGALTLRQKSGQDIMVRALQLAGRFSQTKDEMRLKLDGRAIVDGSPVTVAADASGRTLREVNGKIRLDLGEVNAGGVSVGSTTVSARVDRGVITIDPFRLSVSVRDPAGVRPLGRGVAVSSGIVDISGLEPVVHLASRIEDGEYRDIRVKSVFVRLDGAGSAGNPLRVALSGANTFFSYRREFAAHADIAVSGQYAAGKAIVGGDIAVRDSVTTIAKVRKQPVADVVIVEPGASPPGPSAGGSELWNNTVLNLRLKAPGDNRLEGQGLNAVMTADVKLSKEADDLPALTGAVRVVRGTFTIGSRRLNFTNGTLTFTGSSRIDPQVAAEATGRAGDIMVIVTVQGTLSQPKISLRSDPAMSESDILSYLVLGKPPQGLSSQEQATLQKSAVKLFSDLAARELRDVLGQQFSPDVVSVENRAAGGQRASVGKYVNDRLFVTYEWWWGLDEGRQTIVEYRINRRFTLYAQTGYEQTQGTDLLWTHEY